MKEEAKARRSNLLFVFLIYSSWIVIERFTPYLNRLIDFRGIHPWLLPAIRMTLMLVATYCYIVSYEKGSFSSGFNFRFQKIGKNILWSIIFAAVAGAVALSYQSFIVKPLIHKTVIASSGISGKTTPPFLSRFFEYLYIVYEGIIEVLIFIGFFLDRLAKKWGFIAAVIVGNIGFALWHYSYLYKGWLEGSLMIIMTFLIGIAISLSYVKTRNSLSPVVCHTIVDAPAAIMILLGRM
jgi:membrane protease YdiL (CAAX protease family)